jgi:hypothetical protein
MNWGNGIVLVFSLFVVLVATMVTISFNQDVNLVEKNYYEEEIAYEAHMDKMNNAQKWESAINIVQEKDNLSLYFEGASEVKGIIHMFRPSDAKMDFKLTLAENNLIPLSRLEKGVWQVGLSWEKSGKMYHQEQRVFINK